MKRRIKAGGKAVKAGRRKAATPQRPRPPKSTSRRRSTEIGQTEIARLSRDLKEALEQKTAMSEVLQVISRSAFDLQTVFDTIAENAVRLCEAERAFIFRFDGKVLRAVSTYNVGPELREFVDRNPIAPGRHSISARAAFERRTVHIPDVQADLDYAYATRDRELLRTMLAVPMLKGDELVGTITIYRLEVKPFTDKQTELVQNFAAQAVIAIENTRLLNGLRQRTDDLTESLEQQTATSEVLSIISSSPGELEPVFQTMLEKAVRICQATFGNIYRWDGHEVELVASHNVPPAFAEHRRRSPYRPSEDNAFGRMIATKTLVHAIDAAAERAYTERREPGVVAAVELGGVRTYVAVPLLKDGGLIGVLTVYRKEVRPFTDKQIELLSNFAAQAVIAIENTRLLNELRQRTDDLSQRTADLTEALEQQTATSEVLQVISSSPGDLEPVFNAILQNAARICGAQNATLWIYENGQVWRAARLSGVVDATVPPQPSARSVVMRAIQTKQILHLEDYRNDQVYRDGDPFATAVVDQLGIRTYAAVPMLKEGEPIGAIAIYRTEVKLFSEKQIQLIDSFAAQAVLAIENARLLNELRQRTDELGRSVGELRALGEVSQAVNSTLDLETVLSTIVAQAVQLSGTEAGAIYVFDDQLREFHLRATYGMDRELIDALTHANMGINEPTIARILAGREPIQVADLREEVPSAINEITLRAGYRARLVAPLIRGEDVVGLLVVRRKTLGAFQQNTIDLIKTFGAQSAVAIENARLFQDVEASLHDLRTAQDRLVQTEKLASLGQLTAGIAHEIKNPLNFVNNFSAVSVELIDELREALEGVHLDSKLRAEIGEIADTLQGNLNKVVQHGKRADAIVKNMLLHSRQGSGEHRPVDINALVDESLNLAYHGARAEKQGFTITLEKSFDPAAGEVDIFPQEITRALVNLISNGFYAATKRCEEANGGNYEPTLSAATKNLGNSVEIRIRDNGTGIPPEVREKLFNPFFTTKPAGEGTGLGLSICHDIIVKQHGGSIEVDTQLDQFTEFRIVLPRVGASR